MERSVSRLIVACLACLVVQPARAQDSSIAGVVVDGRGVPVPLARVQIVGGDRATATNDAGHFQFTQLAGARVELRASRLGFQAATQTVALGDHNVRLVMPAVAVNIDQIVVTGTPEATSSRAVGNAVATINAADVNATAPVTDVTEVLTSRSPGVVVNQGSGIIGGGARINLRGSSSMTLSDQPLIYVDGIRVDNSLSSLNNSEGQGGPITRLNDFNPADIESIEILKGPAASTLYGTEAANGVIQIITKHGSASTPARFSATTSDGGMWFQNPAGRFPDAWGRDSTGKILTVNPYQLTVSQGQPAFQTGLLQTYDLNVSGGTNHVTYFADGNYENDVGTEFNTGLVAERGRGNIAVQSGSLSLGANLAYAANRATVPNEGVQGGTMLALYYVQPSMLHTSRDGWGYGSPRQWQTAYLFSDQTHNFTGNADAQFHVGTWFTTHLRGGVNQINEDGNETVPVMSAQLAQTFGASQASGRRTDNIRDAVSTTVDWGASANASLSHAIVSTTSIGLQYYHTQNTLAGISAFGFPAPGVTEIGSAALTSITSSFLQNNTVGTFGQEQLAFNNRLFLTGAVRADDNSAFGKRFRYVLYPKGSVSWVISEEPFWPMPFLNTLKLRAAYGESGQQPRAFDALRTFVPVPIGVAGGSSTAAVTPGTTGNPNLQPEVGKEFEGGFDAGLFHDHLGLQFSYYDKRTHGAIIPRTIPPSEGFPGTQFVNVGALRNSGIELLVNARPVESRPVTLDLTLTAAKNDNVVEKVGNAKGFIDIGAGTGDYLYVGTQRFADGRPAGAWFSQHVVSASYDPASGQAINVLCADGHGGAMSCASAPEIYLGPSQPNFTGSFTPAVTLFGRLHLYALVGWATGYKRPDDNYAYECFSGLCKEAVLPQAFNPVRIARMQRFLIDDFTLQDASFARLREVSASYQLPPGIIRVVRASSASVTLAVRNLALWTRFTGLDPETSYVSEQFLQTNYAITPPLESLIFKLNITY
jgi:TonB-linked SusC/RagA family outer membrane protein